MIQVRRHIYSLSVSCKDIDIVGWWEVVAELKVHMKHCLIELMAVIMICAVSLSLSASLTSTNKDLL